MDPQIVKLTAQIAKIIDSMPSEEGIAASEARSSTSPQKMKLLYLLGVLFDLIQGADGKNGEKGEKGEKGDAGPQGIAGKDGEKGEQGIAGKDGKDGKNGVDGERGPKGEMGERGETGPQGPAGKDGENAPSVTPEMVLDVTMPVIVQNVQKAVASKTTAADEVTGLTEYIVDTIYSYKEVTSDYSIGNLDNLVACIGTLTVTLPTAVGFQREYIIKNVGTGLITVATTSSQTIDGATTFQLIEDEVITLRSTNSNWLIV